jgi:hypothetical protein
MQGIVQESSTDDTLQCPLCLGNYSTSGQKSPKLLPCLHTFCLECVKGFGRRQCATCRKTFVSVEDLADNFLALEHLDSTAIRAGQVRMCEECEDGDSTHRCQNCCRFLCTLCKSQHVRAKATKNHTLVTMDELRSAPREIGARTAELCSVAGHGEQRITMYCFSCSKLVCMQCVIMDHPPPSHICNMIEQAFVSEASQLHSLIGAVENHDSSLESSAKDIQNAITELKNNSDTSATSVASLFENLRTVLTKRKEHLLQEIDEIYQRKAEVLNSQVESMKAASEQMRGAQTFVDHALRSGPKALVLKLKGPINDALSEARLASRSLLVVKENSILSFDAGGSHEIEASIKNLGRIEVGRKHQQPMILASVNGVRPVYGHQLQCAPYQHASAAHEREAEQVAWRPIGEIQQRYSLPPGAMPVQYPDPPLSMAGIQAVPGGHVYTGGVIHQANPGGYGGQINVALPPQQAFRFAGTENMQPQTGIWGGGGHVAPNKYSTLD